MSKNCTEHSLPLRGRFESLRPARGYFGNFQHVGENLRISGWMSTVPRVEFQSFALFVNEELSGVSEPLEVPEQHRHLNPQPQFFAFNLAKTIQETPDFTRVEVLGCINGQPERRLTTMLRWDMDTAVPTPPEKLMYRVTGNKDGKLVKGAGLRCATNFLDAISRYRDLSSVRNILDWGCGCGRVTVHLIDYLSRYEGLQVQGCDIDGEAIDWCIKNLPGGRFRRIDPFPPLPWLEASVDVVVSCSVFTHLTEDVQQLWLEEMRRIIAPGGLFLASVKSFDDANIPARGISDEALDGMLDGIAPAGYYRGTVQSREYTVNRWSRHFEILDFIEDGLEGSQDLVVMRRPLS